MINDNEYWRSSHDGEYKFSNCKFRSLEKHTMRIRRCPCQGGDYDETGYNCDARQIFKVDSEICKYCWVFEHK